MDRMDEPRPRATPVLMLALTLLFVACNERPHSDAAALESVADAGDVSPEAPPVVDITVDGHVQMRVGRDATPAGWTTFRLSNESSAVHFVLLEKLPEGKGIEDYRNEIAPIFQNLMDTFNGKPLSYPELGTTPPEWLGDIQYTGGPGLLSPGQRAAVTVDLEPGTYVLECYVKTADEVFHSVMGMVAELEVTEPASGASEPTSTLAVTIASGAGMEAPAEIAPGAHTVAVHFDDQTTYDHFLGHDVHLVRLDDATDLDALGAWMDWTRAGGLAEPAPATFLGGIQDLPAGRTGYVEVDLEPGRYAWIAEVPDPAGSNMLHAFTVPSELAAAD